MWLHVYEVFKEINKPHDRTARYHSVPILLSRYDHDEQMFSSFIMQCRDILMCCSNIYSIYCRWDLIQGNRALYMYAYLICTASTLYASYVIIISTHCHICTGILIAPHILICQCLSVVIPILFVTCNPVLECLKTLCSRCRFLKPARLRWLIPFVLVWHWTTQCSCTRSWTTQRRPARWPGQPSRMPLRNLTMWQRIPTKTRHWSCSFCETTSPSGLLTRKLEIERIGGQIQQEYNTTVVNSWSATPGSLGGTKWKALSKTWKTSVGVWRALEMRASAWNLM